MNSRIESESFNPLAEFFEHEDHEDQEDEVRRRAYRPKIRNRFYYANRPTRFLPPRVFRRRFVRPFPSPRPRPPVGFPPPYPFPLPVDPTPQPAGQSGPPPDFGGSGGAAPDSWDPQSAAVEPSPDVNGSAATEPGDGDMAQGTDAPQTSGDEEFFEFGAYQREAPAPRKKRTINLGEVVICGGTPFTKLDNFIFGKWTLRKDAVRNHPAQVDAIAREIISRATRGRPVPTVCIVGHTDYIGRIDSNYELGMRRARSVKDALCKRLGKYANNMTFVVNSMGETDPSPRGTTARARDLNRRVDLFLLSERLNGETCTPGGGGGGKGPSDERCGVPRRSPRRELEIAQELGEFEKTGPARRVRVRPKLSLYLLATDSSERNHFHHQAQGTARRISAIEKPNASSCSLRIGPTPYATGADIINAIRAAWECVGKKPIETVHIFGHSNNHGIAGNTPGRAGIRQNSLPIDRADGGRHISEIPTGVLSNNVIFVLHGCRQAEGCNVAGDDDNFAQSLYQHLKAKLSNPQVYGHYNRGCAGRDNSWCLYSKTHPKGKARMRPNYTDPGGCSSSHELESEWEQESSPCERVERFTIDDYGRGAYQLSSSQQGVIDQIKKAISKRERNCRGLSIVEIRGHSSTEGPARWNKDLSQVRANVVKDALGGTIFRARVFTSAKGEEQPLITPDDTEQKQRKNRRVEIFVM